MIPKNPSKLALLIQHASYEKWHLAATLAATTTAMGGEVHIFLSHEALISFVQEEMDLAPPQFANKKINECYQTFLEEEKISKPTNLFKRAKELGPLKFYGCSESVKLFRLQAEYTKKLDGVIGYMTFLDIASDGRFIVI
ncbi:MAG: hypothetical protein HYS07_04275 [Chlamydiae bacterium]|nr:hypothetical protein [Chlamydiota bacterium]MBI3277415.1 hypothetical protein [Chlamydiota bacterium]